jgi:signal transduction histidine kinase
MNANDPRAGFLLLLALAMSLGPAPLSSGAAEPQAASPLLFNGTAPTPTLTNIAGILALSREVAAQPLPAEVEGVVTGTYGDAAFFVDNGQNGIYVENTHPATPVHFGDQVRVVGKTFCGAFSPIIQSKEIQRLGAGTLPRGRAVSYPLLASGSVDSQWLEIRGVVQAVTRWPDQQGVSLDFAMEGGSLVVLVTCPALPDLSWLVDAEVRLHGAASGSFNQKGQMIAPVFRVPDLAMIHLDKPAQTNGFDLPIQRADKLLHFCPVSLLSHRIRVRGVVTGWQPGQTISIYLRDGTDSLKVETAEQAEYQPGEVIDAVGFPTMSTYSAQLRNALCRRVSTQAPPQPTLPTLASVLEGLHDAELLRLRAKVLDWVVDDNGMTLALQSERCLFKGYLTRAQLPSSWSIEKNSQIEITGVCEVDKLQREVWYYQPRSFTLLMRTAQDVTVLQKPPWLNAGRLWRLVSALAVLLAGASAWVWALRKEVNRKRVMIEHQAKHVAVVDERARIARDLHDTVEQGLTGLSLQLKALETSPQPLPQKAHTDLQFARRMLGNTQALTHYAVRQLRDGILPSETLQTGLEHTAEVWNRTGALQVSLKFSGPVPPLPEPLAENLLAVAREAMTNAVKHGQATAIHVDVRREARALRLSVKDNGGGFEPSAAAGSDSGHFGLQGMRERIHECHGALEIRSHPSQGTEVEVKVPLDGPNFAGPETL